MILLNEKRSKKDEMVIFFVKKVDNLRLFKAAEKNYQVTVDDLAHTVCTNESIRILPEIPEFWSTALPVYRNL